MKRKLMTVLLVAMVMLLGLTACAAPDVTGESQESNIPGADDPADGEMAEAAGSLACPLNMTPGAENNYPYMGLSVQIPDRLLNAVLDNAVFMRTDEDVEYTDLDMSAPVPSNWTPNAENAVLHSGCIEFLFLPEGMRERAPHMGMANPMLYDEYEVWITDALPMARLGMYRKSEFQETMLQTGEYAEHRKLGENNDFVYYLSVNEAADELTQEAKDLFATLDDLENGISIFEPRSMDEDYFGITTPEVVSISNVGNFQAETLDGQTIDQSVFSDAKLTMINVWTTWCGPCIEEMPDLESLSRELQDSDVQILGIAYDTSDSRGEVNQETVELAQKIRERTGVSFLTVIPDGNLKDGLLQGILGYPTTWFVDSQGNIIGEPVLGSNSKEDWEALVRERLAEVDK